LPPGLDPPFAMGYAVGMRPLVLHRSFALALFATVLLLLGCSPKPPGKGEGGGVPGKPVWVADDGLSGVGSLSGVWGSSIDDVFVVGGSEAGAEVYHFDGEGWEQMTTPDLDLLVWVHGFGPNEVFTVGKSGSMARYDGSSWTKIDTGMTQDLWGIFGFAPDDLWIVGGDPFTGPPVLAHYDGENFTSYAVVESENPQGAKALFKVWGIEGQLYAVGQLGLILRRDGDKWLAMPAGPKADQDFVSLWGTAGDNIVAVGGRNNARVAHWNGQAWTTVAPEALGGLNAVYMSDPGKAIVGGIFGMVGRYETATASVVRESDPLTKTDVHAMWGDGAGTHVAVGGTFLEPHEGVVLWRSDK
jgi:hypothetical protein